MSAADGLGGLPPERWDEVDALFEAALDQPRDQRRAYVEARARDAQLCAAVLELLAASERAAGFLEPEDGLDAGLLRDAVLEHTERESLEPGSRVGAYLLKAGLGRGGSGTVFLAERADGEYQQRVALKVLRRGLDTDDLLARAVQHAHRNLVVHRDLKPANILVTEVVDADGPRAEVKLLDFGIAKLLEPGRVPADAPATRAEIRLMTPEYASPEQVRGETVTTATDVYQLGILLYELLSGRHPHPLRAVSAAEIERIVCHTDPPLLSVAASDGRGAAPWEVARRRGTDTRRLGRQLRGDLDTIARKALQKEPEQRYASVEQFANDLELYLAGKPIRARRDSRLYRARKFLHRHPFGTVAAVLAALAAAGYLATVAAYAERLERERDRAQLEALRAEQVSRLLTDIFRVSEPDAERGDTLRARTLLDRGAATIVAATAEDPALRATLLEVIGRVYRQIGAYDGAESVLEEALRAAEAVHGAGHPETTSTLRELALLRTAQADLGAAQELAERALRIETRAATVDSAGLAASHRTLAQVRRAQGGYAEAEVLYRQALEITGGFAEGERERADLLTELGSLLRERGQYPAALPLLREALAIHERGQGPYHPTTAASLGALGSLLQDLGELDEAADLLQHALEIRRRQLGDDHPRVASSLQDLAQLHRQRGDYHAAEGLHREAVALRERVHGSTHPDVGSSRYSLAETLRSSGRHAEAETEYRHAIDVLHASLGPDHPSVAFALNGLAEVLRQRGATDEAAALLERALAVRRAALGERDAGRRPPALRA